MMNKKFSTTMILIIMLVTVELAFAGAKIIEVSGSVKVRRGVEESWLPASVGMLLENIDTILTGTDGVVVLETSASRNFKLGNNAVVDISELREITEKELFLFLMSKKVQKIEPRQGKTPLRIGNVSVVHGESKAKLEESTTEFSQSNLWVQEKNGARALFEQEFYTNSIIKYHKIIDNYDAVKDYGEIHFYLGKSFEAMNQTGQAIDAYQEAINRCQKQGCDTDNAKRRLTEARQAIDRLKPKK